jgi:ATP-binding cassette subfamily G (WHITE) protein 2
MPLPRQHAQQNQAAVLFMFIVLPAYGAASYVPSIVLERTLYTRERSDGLYYAITYLLAKMVDELLLATMASVVNAAATFHAIRFQGSFSLFWLIYVLVLYIGIVLAYGIAAISANMDIANALLPAYGAGATQRSSRARSHVHARSHVPSDSQL